MRMREYRHAIKDSMSTTLEFEGREHLAQHIVDALGAKGLVVTDDMIHVTHYGFDDRIGWDEHIIVVDSFGVFGFTDGPCPKSDSPAAPRDLAAETARQMGSSELDSAYGLVRQKQTKDKIETSAE